MEKYRTIRGLPRARSSIKSRSSSSTTGSVDPREKIKDCCRKVVAFMCTQVGVGGLVVGYAIVGAFGFISVEMAHDNKQNSVVKKVTERCAGRLWELTVTENVFNETLWKKESGQVLLDFQRELTDAVKSGYDGRTGEEIWSFPAALMFCLSIFTMIGYGNMTPKTPLGKGLTVVYAVFGIPLYVLYFMNMGKILATSFRWLYIRLVECSSSSRAAAAKRNEGGQVAAATPARVIVPSTACLWVIGGYVLSGTVMFAEWEKWNYLDSVYFCMTSLCKIGIGDFVPGQNISDSREGNQTKLVINFVYLLLGMGLVAMCYNLMREEVRVRAREMKRDFKRCLDDVQIQTVTCYAPKTS